jgi:hypothetical protein
VPQWWNWRKVLTGCLGVGGLLGFTVFDYLDWLGEAGPWLTAGAVVVAFEWEKIEPRLLPILRRVPSVSRRRLAKEADRLAADLLEYAKTHDSSAQSIRDHFETTRQMQAAKSEDEKSQIWNERTAVESQRHAQESHELRELEGGRLSFVLGEFERRGLINQADRHQIEWMATTSAHWSAQAAGDLRGLARRIEPRFRRWLSS